MPISDVKLIACGRLVWAVRTGIGYDMLGLTNALPWSNCQLLHPDTIRQRRRHATVARGVEGVISQIVPQSRSDHPNVGVEQKGSGTGDNTSCTSPK
jgi:hypothetical protein